MENIFDDTQFNKKQKLSVGVVVEDSNSWIEKLECIFKVSAEHGLKESSIALQVRGYKSNLICVRQV